MSRLLFAINCVLAAAFWVAVLNIVWSFTEPKPVRYDCSLAEISPDMPLEVRKQCRKVRT